MRIGLILLTAACAAASPTRDQFRDSLIPWEGLKTTPYRDKGDLTVGIGHNLSASGKPVKTHYTAQEIEMLFGSDLYRALTAARSGITDFDCLPDQVQVAVVNLIWGVGPTGFMKFRNLRIALSYRAYESAAAELADSRWYRQVPAARARWVYRAIRQ